jgi:DNA invertase Pin-like site-specific DNA recombinase
MSTDLQLKGDSRRRQLEASRAYAMANGLELAEGAELEDIGISAFKGANVSEGALGRFLGAVKAGSVKPGSYLLVESLDRLSRQQILAAQALFLSIVQAGIHLVTLADGRVYRAGMTDLGDLIVSLVIMSRAHEESQTKSHRISAAWKNKRAAAADQKPMTKWCPAWLKLSPDRSQYIPIASRVEIVRGIFGDAVAGIGMYSIASRLNRAKVPTFKGPNGWHQSYVAKILANRAAIGELQPHVRKDGKRVSDGDPVQNYYPAIIDEQLFYQVQLAKSQRRVSGAGRKGSGFTNLFSGIAKCAYCRSSITFENKGRGPKGGTYLVCDGARRQRNCPSVRWRYRDFEASFLAFVEELDVESVINANSRSEQRSKLDGELAALKGELSSVIDLMEKTYAVLNEGGPVAFVTGKLNELDRRRVVLDLQIKDKSEQHQELQSRETRYRRSKEELKRLVDRLQSPASEELFRLRAQIASQLKVLIQTLSIGSLGMKPRLRASVERLWSSTGDKRDAAMDSMIQAIAEPRNSQRYFAVGFRDSNARVVFPNDDDPLRYEQQIIASDLSGFEVFVDAGPRMKLRVGPPSSKPVG